MRQREQLHQREVVRRTCEIRRTHKNSTMRRIRFVPIEGFYGLYFVSSNGEVYSTKTMKPLHQEQTKNGYMRVQLWKDGRKKNYKVHRLVAKAFIENPKHLPEVNHKDENKQNNAEENLEWVSRRQNIRYGKRTERQRKSTKETWNKKISHGEIPINSKRVKQLTKDGKVLNHFLSISQAADSIGAGREVIASACHGRIKTAYGFLWRFE